MYCFNKSRIKKSMNKWPSNRTGLKTPHSGLGPWFGQRFPLSGLAEVFSHVDSKYFMKGKSPKSINVGPTSIPESRVYNKDIEKNGVEG